MHLGCYCWGPDSCGFGRPYTQVAQHSNATSVALQIRLSCTYLWFRPAVGFENHRKVRAFPSADQPKAAAKSTRRGPEKEANRAENIRQNTASAVLLGFLMCLCCTDNHCCFIPCIFSRLVCVKPGPSSWKDMMQLTVEAQTCMFPGNVCKPCPCLSTVATRCSERPGRLLHARSASQNRAAERDGGQLSHSSVVNASGVNEPVRCNKTSELEFSWIPATLGSSLQALSQAAGVSMLTLVMVGGDSSRKTAGQCSVVVSATAESVRRPHHGTNLFLPAHELPKPNAVPACDPQFSCTSVVNPSRRLLKTHRDVQNV